MSEMVERVAQAICGDDNPDNILSVHRSRARAAIEAMREPTQGMIDAAPLDMTTDGSVIQCWQALIDEALK